MLIDDIDTRILRILQDNARTSNAEIARQVGMAPSAILERIRKLERKGVILGYQTRLSPAALGNRMTAYTLVHTEEALGTMETAEHLSELPEVIEVHYVAGQDSYLVKTRTRDPEHMTELLKTIGRIATVRSTRTTIVLSTVKEIMNTPVEFLPKDSDGN